MPESPTEVLKMNISMVRAKTCAIAYSTITFVKLDKAWYTEQAIGVMGGTNGYV